MTATVDNNGSVFGRRQHTDACRPLFYPLRCKKRASLYKEALSKNAGQCGYAASAMTFHSLAVSSMSLPPMASNSVARS